MIHILVVAPQEYVNIYSTLRDDTQITDLTRHTDHILDSRAGRGIPKMPVD